MTEKLILDAVYEWEQKAPNQIWLTQPLGGDAVRDYTWGEALQEARRMAAYLRSLDLPAGSNIGMISKNCAEFVLADLAIWMAGHVSVALYPTLNAETVDYILNHAEAKAVFVGKLDDWDQMKSGVPEGIPKVAFTLAPKTDFPSWADTIAAHEPITDSPTPDPDALAIIVYTSGSTGQPKGVMHSFRSMSKPAAALVDIYNITTSDRALSYLPLAHVMERALVECAGFYSGGRIFFAESLDTFVQDLQRASPTLFISVPRLWLKFQIGVLQKMPEKKLNTLLKIPILGGIVRKKILTGLGLQSVRVAGSGSAPIPAELIAWYRNLGLALMEGYGMSEDFCYSHLSMPEKSKPGCVGVPYPDVETRISEEGEIQIKSPGNMLGYYKEPEMTAECYTDDGYFKTGDRGEYDADGLLRITGRVKELFKTSKGKYVAPAPIENLINTDRHIEISCVSGLGRPAPYGLVMLAEDIRGTLDEQSRAELTTQLGDLLKTVNSKVENFERLQFLAVVKDEWLIENGFLTPTMKIKRAVLEDTYGPNLDSWYESGEQIIWQ